MTKSISEPTLWRTCRVLANRTRLRVFGLLVSQSPLTVSTVAKRLQLPLPVASQSLRALESRALLVARRVGRHTYYGISRDQTAFARALIAALRSTFQRCPFPVNLLFRLSTAFTHPRRIDIYRALESNPRTLDQIQTVTRVSTPALLRHLRKLEARGFVGSGGREYLRTQPAEEFGRVLGQLATTGDANRIHNSQILK